MMFLSFSGFPIKSPIPAALVNEAIHQFRVLQKYPAARNILTHLDRLGTIWIDFERATLFSPRVILESLSANRKRKLGVHDGARFPTSENGSAKEIARATAELVRLVGSTSFRGSAGG